MLEKFENNFGTMYPIGKEVYWRVMRQHYSTLVKNASLFVFTDSTFNFASTKYNYYRYFIEMGLEKRYWVPTLVINNVMSIYDDVDTTDGVRVLDEYQIVEDILSTIHE